jgi:GH24 family phage-related lysozyme (muramidase)
MIRRLGVPFLNSGNWDPGLHPRDSDGEFRYNGGRHRVATSNPGGSNPMVPGSKGFQIALQFIVEREVSDKNYYDRHDTYPTIPAAGSGITIGIGYDLGQVDSVQRFEADWGGLLDPATMARLLPYVQNPNPTQADLAQLHDIKIPWDAAVKEFEEQTLPQAIEATRGIYQQLDDLPPESQAALVSLVYNRGVGLKGKAPTQMANIQKDLKSGKLENVSDEFKAMKKLRRDLAARRQMEGDLFAKGLTNAKKAK